MGSARLDPKLFGDAEKALHDAAKTVDKEVARSLDARKFDQAIGAVVALRKPIDTFYDAVMIMDKDDKLRRNRLALLASIVEIFTDIADFSKIVVQG